MIFCLTLSFFSFLIRISKQRWKWKRAKCWKKSECDSKLNEKCNWPFSSNSTPFIVITINNVDVMLDMCLTHSFHRYMCSPTRTQHMDTVGEVIFIEQKKKKTLFKAIKWRLENCCCSPSNQRLHCVPSFIERFLFCFFYSFLSFILARTLVMSWNKKQGLIYRVRQHKLKIQ